MVCYKASKNTWWHLSQIHYSGHDIFIPIGVRSSFRIKTNLSVPRLTWISQMSTLLDTASYCLRSISNMLLFKASICVYVSVQSCPTLCDPMDCSLPGSSVHGISQVRILEWVTISSSRGSSQPRDQTHISYISCIGRWLLYHCTTLEAQSFYCMLFKWTSQSHDLCHQKPNSLFSDLNKSYRET